MAADRTPNELADEHLQILTDFLRREAEQCDGVWGQAMRASLFRAAADRVADLRAAAVLLREQAEQLDTLRNAIGPVTNIRRVAAQLPDATSYSLASLALWMEAVADAVDALAAAGGGVPEKGATDE